MDNINLFNQLNRDIINYLPYLIENKLGITVLAILIRLFMYDEKQSIRNLFICEIQFDFLKNSKYYELL